YVLDDAECKLVSEQLFTEHGTLRAGYIGKSASELAAGAGLEVPADTKLLIAPQHEIGNHIPLSRIKPGPMLALYRADDAKHALQLAEQLLELGAAKHSAVIHSYDEEVKSRFSKQLQVNRLTVN